MGSDVLEDYILAHTEPEPDYLYRLWRATNIHTIHGRMASGHLQGRLLKMLVQMIRPERILEVGTFSGYSAISMAEGLSGDGHLYTFEINDEMEDFTRPWIEGSPVADRITFIIGDALTEAPKLGLMFDMAFIDGDKRTYRACYEMVMSLLKPGRFYPRRQYPLGRAYRRSCLRPRPSDARHRDLQRLYCCRRPRGASDSPVARWPDVDKEKMK